MKGDYRRLCVYYLLGFLVFAITLGLLAHNESLNRDYRMMKSILEAPLILKDRLADFDEKLQARAFQGTREEVLEKLPKEFQNKARVLRQEGYFIDEESFLEERIYVLHFSPQGARIGSFLHPSMAAMSLKFFPHALVPFIGVCLLTNFWKNKYRRKLSLGLEELLMSLEYNNEIIVTENEPILRDFGEQVRLFQQKYHGNIEGLRNQLSFMEDVYRNLSEGLVLLDTKGEILSLNPESVKMLSGSPFVDYRGKPGRLLFGEGALGERVEQALKSGVEETFPLEQDERYLRVYLYPMLEEGTVVGMVVLLHDIGHQVTLDTMRREFTSNVTHELKTPLTSIQGYAELLQSGFVPVEDQKKVATVILEQSRRLFELINSLLELSRLEESSGVKDFEPVALDRLIAEILPAFEPALKERDIVFELRDRLKRPIFANASILKEVLGNLIENAIIYNKNHGMIVVEFFLDRYIHITVADRGIGMSPAVTDRIFERFFMVDESRSVNKKSTGLGLAIVKHGVLYHGGEISVSSKPGEGSTFEILLPKGLLVEK